MYLSIIIEFLIFLPIFFIGLLFFVNPFSFKTIKQLTLLASIILLIFFSLLSLKFSNFYVPFQFIQGFSYNFFFNINYILGLDIINFLFIGLTIFLIPLCILVSWNSFILE